MNTIITNEDYRNILRNQKIREYKVVIWIMICVGFFMLIQGAVIGWTTTDEFLTIFIWFLIPLGIMFGLAFVFYFLMKKTQRNPFESKIYQNYVDYQTDGTKIPLYRVINYGKSSETVNMILDINEDRYMFYDVRRKKMKQYLSCKSDELIFHFFYKNRQGIETLKKKLHLEINGSTKRIFIMREIGEKFIPFLKAEGYKYQEK